VGRAAHEIKDALNGVSLNVEVIRSRSSQPDSGTVEVAPFAVAAAEQLEVLAERNEALLFLTRAPRSEQTDVGQTLRHLATLMVPATRSDGGTLEVQTGSRSQPAQTSAPATAVRLALGAGLLALTGKGGTSRCRLEHGQETLVRFSHESAASYSLDPPIAEALAVHQIRLQRPDNDLLIVFPAS